MGKSTVFWRFFGPLDPPRGKFYAYKIIKIVNSEFLETHDAQAPFTFWGKGWGRGLQTIPIITFAN
jgi:hypothetical protein